MLELNLSKERIIVMTLQEIAAKMMEEIDRFSVVEEVEIPKTVQIRTHKK